MSFNDAYNAYGILRKDGTDDQASGTDNVASGTDNEASGTENEASGTPIEAGYKIVQALQFN